MAKMTRAEENTLREQFMSELRSGLETIFGELFETDTGQVEVPFGERVFSVKTTLHKPDFDLDEAVSEYEFKRQERAAKAEAARQKKEEEAKRKAEKAAKKGKENTTEDGEGA